MSYIHPSLRRKPASVPPKRKARINPVSKNQAAKVRVWMADAPADYATTGGLCALKFSPQCAVKANRRHHTRKRAQGGMTGRRLPACEPCDSQVERFPRVAAILGFNESKKFPCDTIDVAGCVFVPREPSSVPGYVKHVRCEGARFHVLSWDSQGCRCSEPDCVINASRKYEKESAS